MDIRDKGVCRWCWENFEECEICMEKFAPEEVPLMETHNGDEVHICKDCAEGMTCEQCGKLYPNDDELYHQLVMKFDGWRAKLLTYEESICPSCVKLNLNTYQPVLQLEESGKLLIGRDQKELFERGIKGTPNEQARPIGFWDLVKGKQIGQTEMYYAQKFDKLICSHGGE
jgi:hypothetical protein